MKHKCCYCYSICKSSLNNFEKCLTRQSMVYGLSSNSLFQLFSAWGEADYSGIEPMFSKSASARKIEIRQLRKRKVHYIVRSLDFRLLNRSICLQRPQNSTTLSLKFIKLFFFFYKLVPFLVLWSDSSKSWDPWSVLVSIEIPGTHLALALVIPRGS